MSFGAMSRRNNNKSTVTLNTSHCHPLDHPISLTSHLSPSPLDFLQSRAVRTGLIRCEEQCRTARPQDDDLEIMRCARMCVSAKCYERIYGIDPVRC